jgi:hypothetical protein
VSTANLRRQPIRPGNGASHFPLVDFPRTEEAVTVIKVNMTQEKEDSQDASTQPRVIGNSLDRFIGIWSEEEAEEFLKAIEVFGEIDESLWS